MKVYSNHRELDFYTHNITQKRGTETQKTEMPIDSPAEKKHKDCQHGKKKKNLKSRPNPRACQGKARAVINSILITSFVS
jgi:hypothetical protein